jgi:hypothetical protein
LSYKNFRILELAHWVRKALQGVIDVEIEVEYGSRVARSYRVSTKKIERVLGFRSVMSVEESARHMAEKVRTGINADFHNPRYDNIRWLETLLDMEAHLKRIGSIF